MPNFCYRCDGCEVETVEFYKFEERPVSISCTSCGASSYYQIATPMILKASYPDGTKRFQDMKEAAKLNKESAGAAGQETKKEIAREIRKLGVGVSK